MNHEEVAKLWGMREFREKFYVSVSRPCKRCGVMLWRCEAWRVNTANSLLKTDVTAYYCLECGEYLRLKETG